MDLIFTDLDGTLLDRDTYSWQAAQPALDLLRQRAIPWILVSSKTRAEIEFWREQLRNDHPFVVENGAAAYVPLDYFSLPGASKRPSSYQAIEWGTPYEALVADLQRSSRKAKCRVRGFHEMTLREVAERTGLPLEQAALAKQREYDEAFVVLDPDRAGALANAIEDQGRQWTRGGRFWHIMGANDKALAVRTLAALFTRGDAPPRTIGLGDALNDASFLDFVTTPVLILSPQTQELKARLPMGQVTNHGGPAGWNEAVLSLIGG